MSNHSIKAVLLDYGGVIADEGFQNALRAMAREQGLDEDTMMNVARSAVYDSGFILGRGSEDQFWKWMREGSGLKGSDTELTQRVLDGFSLRPWMMEWVQQLNAQGYVTGILSDQSHWLDWLNERDHFFEYFDHVFNSYHMGEGKRNPALFPEISEQLALSPDEILLVDDMKSNVTRAQAEGWQTIHYVDKENFLEMADKLLEQSGSGQKLFFENQRGRRD
jgi:putative hydrolase of the HAD superfamily